MTRSPQLTRMLAIATTVLLLVAAGGLPWLTIHPGVRPAFFQAVVIVSVAFVLGLHLAFVHLELMSAVVLPGVLACAATLGVMGVAGQEIDPANWKYVPLFAGITQLPLAYQFRQRLRVFRHYGPTDRSTWVWVVSILAIALCAIASGNGRSNTSVAVLMIATHLLAAAFILPALAQWLLPSDAIRLPPTLLRVAGSRNFLRRLRALYSYLDIAEEQYVTWKLRLDPIFRSFFAAVPDSAEVLDAGCGCGLMSNGLAMQGPHRLVTGIDFDERKLRVARCAARTVHNVRFVSGDLLTCDFPASDCVLMIDILHYWSADKQSQLVAKAAASLRPGGVIIFREGLNAPSLAHRLIHLAERGAVLLGQNPKGDGLCFQDRAFYLDAFSRNGMALEREATDWGHGSNTVLVLRKAKESS